jgi:hydrogenase expression/formation protein HypC
VCLGIPGAVLDLYETSGIRMGHVDFGGAAREVCMAYVPEVEVGDYVIVHVGFAISVLDQEEAAETLALIGEAFGFEPAMPEPSGPEP